MTVWGRVRSYALILAFGFVLVFVLIDAPARVRSGAVRPAVIGGLQVAGTVIAGAGGMLALWCVAGFAVIGRGTPAPFAPPSRLVTAGPYRFVRNPMYVGVGSILVGAAVFYESPPLLGYAGLFFLAGHLFVIGYEEPTLRRTFGPEYEAYCARVRRWCPRRPPAPTGDRSHSP